MGRQIRLNREYAKTDAELLCDLYAAAGKYQLYVNKKILYIYRSNRKDAPYESYEVFFGKENFMHLAGFKKRIIGAAEFYDRCLFHTLRICDVEFKESRKAASAKLDVLKMLLDYRHVKIYKAGEADLVREKNRFETGIGNAGGILGFDRRKQPPALPVPVTVMKRPLTDYVSQPKNVIAVLIKNSNSDYYGEVVGCVANGIKENVLPGEIQAKIMPSLLKDKITVLS